MTNLEKIKQINSDGMAYIKVNFCDWFSEYNGYAHLAIPIDEAKSFLEDPMIALKSNKLKDRYRKPIFIPLSELKTLEEAKQIEKQKIIEDEIQNN